MGKEEWVRISQLLFFFVQNQRPTKCVPLSKQAVNVLHQTNHLSSCQLRVVSSLGRGELSHFVLKPTSCFRNVPPINFSNKDMNKDFGAVGGIQESFKDFSLVKKLDSILGTFRYIVHTSSGRVNIVLFDIIVTASLKAKLRLERSTMFENHRKKFDSLNKKIQNCKSSSSIKIVGK